MMRSEDPASIRLRARAGALWAFRAGAELDASARFERIASALVRQGAHATLVDLARAAAIDELRHYDRCATLARRFGADVPAKSVRVAQPLCTDLGDARRATLYETIAMGCVTESLSVALLLAMLDAAIDEEVADTIREILRDEVQHSRLGWAHLAAEQPQMAVDFIAERLPKMLADTVHEEVFAGPQPHEDATLAGLGALPRFRRAAVVADALDQVVFPGLERFGIDVAPARAWLARQRSGPGHAAPAGPRGRDVP